MILQQELEVAKSLAQQAAKVLRDYQSGPVVVDFKANNEVVTPADRDADELLRDGLRQAFPNDAVFSEEAADSSARLSSPRVWIVDPIDSTSNFASRGDEYSISIGLAIDGRPAAGVVCNPARNELFAGALDQGVTLNDSAAHVGDASEIRSARLLVSRKEWLRGLDKVADLLPIRPVASMAYKLARVACGLDDGAFSLKARKEWGTCAGVALVIAAGGRATLLDGSEIRFNRTQQTQPMGMVAAGPTLHRLLLDALPRILADRR